MFDCTLHYFDFTVLSKWAAVCKYKKYTRLSSDEIMYIYIYMIALTVGKPVLKHAAPTRPAVKTIIGAIFVDSLY